MKSINPYLIIGLSIVAYLTIYVIDALLSLDDNIYYDVISNIIDELTVLITLYIISLKYYDLNIIKFKRSGIFVLALISILIAVLIIIVNYFIFNPINNFLIPGISWIEELHDEMYPVLRNNMEYILFFISTCLLTPFFEEIYFRGFCYGIVRKKYSRAVSVLTVILVFILFHPIPQMILISVFLNIILCYLYELSGTLLPGMIIHSLYNIVGIFLIYK